MARAEGVTIQQGFAISAGEIVREYTVEFPLTAGQLGRAEKGNGFVLFWGKVFTVMFSGNCTKLVGVVDIRGKATAGVSPATKP
jgi:hypothetical protein